MSDTHIPPVSTTKISPSIPTDVLEVRAAEQRVRLHESVAELRSRVKDKLDVEAQAREHVWPAAGVAALVSMVLGYGAASMMKGVAPNRRYSR